MAIDIDILEDYSSLNSKAMRYLIASLSFFIIASCSFFQSGEGTIKAQLKSNRTLEIIQACNNLKMVEDTIFVALLLENPYDQHVCHDLRYEGIPVYEAKMNALKRISGLNPPNKITYHLDSVNVAFYLSWAKGKGYFR